jgi:GTP pyrophosphokinase
MRGIKNINFDERKRLAQETLDIYAPLANRLGIGQIKWELEDISFHYIDPQAYKKIAAFLAERRTDRENRIQENLSLLKNEFTKTKIKATISGRAKHIYSIYRKAQKKQLDYQSIFDYSALRILVPTIDDCYAALSIINNLWENIPEEFDDYIASPKPNGYRSIHTAVIDQEGKHFEIQIRTYAMHEEAEHGISAHWVYKEDKENHNGYEIKITFLRQLLNWHRELAQQNTNPDKTFQEIFEDRIYVFTPENDIIDLPTGATPLDFAYYIHSGLGHRCRGAKINGHIVQLTYTLHTGDRVEIITTQNGTPSRDWLRKDAGYIKTARARAKIAHFFKEQDVGQSIETGKHALEKEFSHKREMHSDTVTVPTDTIHSKITSTPATHFQVSGIENLLTRVAKCCKPIPGDTVIGYITQGRGVSIHRQDCNNISRLTFENQNRLIQVNWNQTQLSSYYVDLQIRSYERDGLLKELTALLANAKVNLIAINSIVNQKNNTLLVIMTIQLRDVKELKQLIQQISQVEMVYEVKRE